MAKKRKVEASEDPESITDTNGVQTKKTKVKKVLIVFRFVNLWKNIKIESLWFQGKWANKQRVMVFCARGITHR